MEQKTTAVTINKLPLATHGKYLNFRLGEEIYGINILNVQEIIGLVKISKLPSVPFYVRGVIDLRGKVIMVIDTRLKLALAPADDSEKTCIVLVETHIGESKKIVGFVVDEVKEVVDLHQDQIEPAPSFDSFAATALIGVGKLEHEVVMIIAVDRLMTAQDDNCLEQIA